jgi:RNA polymerase sigma factor (sigma-70 family)
MRPEEVFLENLGIVERICTFIGRRNHLSDDDTAEFTSEAKFRLIENDYAIIRKFEGRALLSTYLTTVLNRLYHQYRIEQRGKWRPSAEARRLGDDAVVLERLTTRDGLTLHEAIETLTTGASRVTRDGLEQIYLRLPARPPRPVLVSDEVTGEIQIASDTDERIGARERQQTARAVIAVIDGYIEGLPAEDCVVLRMRFHDRLQVPEIASRLHIDQRRIYKRLDKHLKAMRRALEEAGVGRDDVDEMVQRGDQEVRVGMFTSGTPGKKAAGPSHTAGGEITGNGESRLSK